jgi:hypothetical protein
MERDVGVGAIFAEIDFAGVERPGINVNAHGALLEFRKIKHLMDGFEGIDVCGMDSVHFVDVRGNEAAGAAVGPGGVAVLDMKILDFEAADGRGHPAILIAMIVDAAELSDLPANGHALEEIVLEDEIAGVIPFGPEEIFFDGFGADGVGQDEVLNIFEGEVALGNSGEFLDPIGDVELRRKSVGHGKPRRRL